MQSKKRVEPLDSLERDLPLTPEDVDFLWRVKELDRMTPQEYAEFIETFRPMHPPSRETNSPADEPFEL